VTTLLRRRSARARRGEQGSVIVEAAIIIPVLLFLTFGAIEFGLAFRDSASVAASTRSGARIAAAMPGVASNQTATPPVDGFQDAARKAVNLALKDLTKAQPVELVIFKADTTTGYPIGQATPNYDACSYCFIYTWNSSTKAFNSTPTNSSFWAAGPATQSSPPSQLYDACNGVTDAIGVYVRAQQPFITGLWGTKTYDHVTVMRLEPVGTDSCG
jgi:Flp pilus assembly protein TadG